MGHWHGQKSEHGVSGSIPVFGIIFRRLASVVEGHVGLLKAAVTRKARSTRLTRHFATLGGHKIELE